MTVNVNNFLLNTDYPLDKIIYLNSVSFSAPDLAASPSYVYTIAHGLPFTPLVSGSWSTSPDFSVNYDYFTGTPGSHSTVVAGYVYTVELRIYADATNIYILPVNVSGSSVDVYARIFAFEPDDSQSSLSPTQSLGDNFILNTDYNYTKLFTTGHIDSVTSSSTYTVNHNLGIVPQVMVWIDDTSYGGTKKRYPNEYLSENTGDLYQVGVIATTTSITFKTGVSSYLTRIDYRIYYDESGV